MKNKKLFGIGRNCDLVKMLVALLKHPGYKFICAKMLRTYAYKRSLNPCFDNCQA